ncbi:inovirus-type Gp2 protein, partial [Vibrio sp.]|uniref:YagK/YfjJ domain-containing protein n=1 Tax=Vibrio sp. TaxID=678 RepID=UPI0037B18276
NSFFNITSFLSCEKRDTITLYRPNWLNFNSDNYPARGGFRSVSEERLRYIWCKEIDKSENPHYHLVIFLNKDNFQSLGDFKRVIRDERKCKHLYQMLLCAWSRVLGVELEEAHKVVYIPDNATYKVRSFEGEAVAGNNDFTKLFNRSIYLAKARTQAIGVSRSFGRSSK